MSRRRKPRTMIRVPAPTLLEGAAFLVLWAQFTGRVEVEQ